MNAMRIKFKPENCIGCLSCMTIDECRSLIDAIRRGGPRFKECKNNCTKCIDICPEKALILRY